MAREKYPVTPAIRLLRAAGLPFECHLYPYEERGGTATSSRHLGVDEHCVVKTLVMEDEGRRPFIMLMHGDREVSTRELARQMGVRSVTPCTPESANRHSGYLVGGTSPLGVRHPMRVYFEKSILELDSIYINGGKRGFLVSLDPRQLVSLLDSVEVCVAIER